MIENLDNEQINRLLEYRLHLENNFNNRLNFFLVFESVLIAMVGVLYSRPSTSILVARLVIILGFSLTLIWGYVQARQKYVVYSINELMEEIAPEYKLASERRKRRKWPISSIWLLTYLVPGFIALTWVVLLFLL
jgi:hypothetical protein